MWIGLVFVACLATAETSATDRGPARHRVCREVEVPFDGSLIQCMLLGQQGIVGWLAENQRWELTGGYRCLAGRPA